MARKTDTFLSQSQELDPARKDKLEAEEIEASAKLKLAQGKLAGYYTHLTQPANREV